MRNTLALLILSMILLSACKKKSDGPATTMTVNVGSSDSSWTATGISTAREGEFVKITAHRPGSSETVILAIYNYRTSAYTYTIDNNGVQNTALNNAYYTSSNTLNDATSGEIDITSHNSGTFSGTFYFWGTAGLNISGTFTAVNP